MEIEKELQMPTAALLRVDNEDSQTRALSWTDTDDEGLPVCRMLTLTRKGNIFSVEIEDWDAHAPDLLSRGSGAVIMETHTR